VPPTPGQPKKEPMLLRLAVGLLDSQGRDMRLTSVKDGASLHNLTSADGDFTTTAVLHVDKVCCRLRVNSLSPCLCWVQCFEVFYVRNTSFSRWRLWECQAEQEFTFVDIAEKPVPSLLRNFSAPVRLVSDVTNDDLFFLLAHDSDQFNRYG
jgi:aminopeptidase N